MSWGTLAQYIGKDRKLFPWEREYHATSISGAKVTFHRDDVNRKDGYVSIRRDGGETTVFDTAEFVAAVRELFEASDGT